MSDLDAAIRAHLKPMPTVDEWGSWARHAYDAIIAVLDLHEPHPSMPTDCFRCDTTRPCTTVRTIAEKLGVSQPTRHAPLTDDPCGHVTTEKGTDAVNLYRANRQEQHPHLGGRKAGGPT